MIHQQYHLNHYNDLVYRYEYVDLIEESIYGILCTRRTDDERYEIYVPYAPIVHCESYSVDRVTIESVMRLYTDWTNVELWKRWCGFFISFDYPEDLSDHYGKLVNVYLTVTFPTSK